MKAYLTVLLVDDSPSQAELIQECLLPYGIHVELRGSYRAAVEVLRDADLGQLVDLVLIDQAFDSEAVRPHDLLTAAEIDAQPGTAEWDVRLHQGLYILSRLSRDMREGRIPFTRMMILTHYARLEIAAQTDGLGGYLSKRLLLTNPYGSLKGYLEQMRPIAADVDERIGELSVDLGVHRELADVLRQRILDGLDPDEVYAALRRIPDLGDWRKVGPALDRLAADWRAFPVERMAEVVAGAWFASSDGWLRVCHVEPIRSLEHDFEAFRVHLVEEAGRSRWALLAARAMRADSAPCAVRLRGAFQLVREIDPRSRPIRLRAGGWTIVGCWLPEPAPAGQGAAAALRRLRDATRQVRRLHERKLAHGSLSELSVRFERPIFGGLRCLAGHEDLDELRSDDLRRLPELAATALGEHPPAQVRHALTRWRRALEAGDFASAERGLELAPPVADAPAYLDLDPLVSGGERGFRDRLLASLGPADAVLRDVGCEQVPGPPIDFVVCAGGAVVVLDHRPPLQQAARCEKGVAAEEPEPEGERYGRSLARCQRCADVLADGVEAALGLRPRSIRRIAAVVVGGGTRASRDASGWRPVLPETEAVAELARISRRRDAPRGVDMARCLPRSAQAESREDCRRALHWTAHRTGDGLTRMRTLRKRLPGHAWESLLGRLADGHAELSRRPQGERPLPLLELTACDDGGEPRDIQADRASIELIEYRLRVPAGASPLASYIAGPRDEADRRRTAADVLRGLQCWERAHLAYSTMGPGGLVYAGGRVYPDLLQSVQPLDPASRRHQRAGAAACLVLLLSPWPYAWPAVLNGSQPILQDRPGEDSAWGIAAAAVKALLDPDARSLDELLAERADLLDAAALLGARFPALPPGLARAGR